MVTYVTIYCFTNGDWYFTDGNQVLADVRWGIQYCQLSKEAKIDEKWNQIVLATLLLT